MHPLLLWLLWLLLPLLRAMGDILRPGLGVSSSSLPLRPQV